jgi:hypothetical protein
LLYCHSREGGYPEKRGNSTFYATINLAKEIQSIKVPLYFFEGKYDMATSRVPVEKFYNSLDAEKGKKLILFEKLGTLPDDRRKREVPGLNSKRCFERKSG